MKDIFLLLFLISVSVFSQTRSDTTDLDEVNIKTSISTEKAFKSKANVSFLHKNELERSDQRIITPLLNKMPGVYMMQGGLNTTKINIRGIGARAQYETNRLKLYYNNIPLTTANGTSILHDIDLSTIDEVQVIKGPQATRYGAGLGGVIRLRTSLEGQDRLSSEWIMGSFDLLKQNYTIRSTEDKRSFQLTYNNQSSGGFRENSNYQRESYFIDSEWEISPTAKLQFLGQVTQLKAFIPSSLGRTAFEEDPSQAAFTWGEAQGYESYTRGIFGLNLTKRINENIEQNTSVFTNFRDAYEPRPFDILEENNLGMGIRHISEMEFDLLGMGSKLSIGGEFLRDNYEVATFENLYASNDGDGSLQGEKLSDLTQDRQYIEGFSTFDLNISDEWQVRLGLVTNKTSYNINDKLSSAESSQSGDLGYDQVWLPNIVGTYHINEEQKLQASISRGFSVPTVEQSLNEEGRFNTDLQPEKGWNYELGYKAKWLDNRLYTGISAYYLDVTNLLVARRVAEDRFVGANAGSTDHPGIEISARANFDHHWLNIQPFFNASFNFYEFDTFVDQEEDFSGNDLTGVPSQQLSFGLEASILGNFSLYFQTNAISAIPVNDENTVYTDAYSISNLRIGYQFSILKRFTAQVSLMVNNLLDENYASSIVTNAIGFGGSEPRYFYPGEPRNYMGSVELRYRL